ncbi:hypothetical protein I5Q82_03015 [Acutalibacter muris]|uniref:Uncharacterized protein n=1 Tax=Acutalibacter muris TaxID=1796620 RepID=A0A1Z2XSQ1_9FIRM|nr:hypothetical protein [Acutalibacter muris]ANU55330.1 hypothetical protein A4V00_15635 [Hungateiclostridiaceae bacterium KB18]ASB41435.1 hypothetical protein ADH66_12710 [Acutalibacter muris]QQR30691.1 hypothetical protein I5Q82_03015 [Acutalibacter muris]
MSEYEEYQLRWMIDHGYSLQDLMNELDKYQLQDRTMSVSELFGDWEYESGFQSEIWACEDEWLECEGANEMEQSM